MMQKIRHTVQAAWAFVTNSYLAGFVQGRIYMGQSKRFCVPGLNCYSCPGARGACPIGALQAVIGSRDYKVTYYVSGFLILMGALFGRAVCGWLCPFGLIQELLHKIPVGKKIKTFRGDRFLRKLKYLILLIFVILLPMFLVDLIGQGSPYFCKLICPAGTLEGGIPLVLLNRTLRTAIGFLYGWKVLLLILTVIASILIWRPFCKYVCPLGAVYSVFNPVSLCRLQVDESRCVSCGKCREICGMALDPRTECDHPECIRCGKCVEACPADAISRVRRADGSGSRDRRKNRKKAGCQS